MGDEDRTEQALRLIERADGVLKQRVGNLRTSNWCECGSTVEQTRLEASLRLLEVVADHIVDEHGPDEEWYEDYFTVTGQHVILTEEGWVPGDMKAEMEPDEVLGELNEPTS